MIFIHSHRTATVVSAVFPFLLDSLREQSLVTRLNCQALRALQTPAARRLEIATLEPALNQKARRTRVLIWISEMRKPGLRLIHSFSDYKAPTKCRAQFQVPETRHLKVRICRREGLGFDVWAQALRKRISKDPGDRPPHGTFPALPSQGTSTDPSQSPVPSPS